MEFSHSLVLFCGDDGLPIEFNIQNTVEKEKLKTIIENAGGLCTLSDEAIILVSPGTKVVNIYAAKTLTSSRYVFDCIKNNSKLNIEDYRVEIQEMETSDFSDNSASLCEKPKSDGRKSSEDIVDNSVDIIQPNATSMSPCHNSNHDFDFEASESQNNVILPKKNVPDFGPLEIPLQPSGNCINFNDLVEEKNKTEACVNAVPDSLDFEESAHQIMPAPKVPIVDASAAALDNGNESALKNRESSAESIVSSSQPNVDGLDQFDNMILTKAHDKPVENVQNEDSLSQSYTVSSSADAQLSPKLPSHTSGEIFDGNSAVADSDTGGVAERQRYINELEKEVEEILKKPSPKSIQDKTTLVKYICIVKKLPPAIVLQTLQNF